MQRDPDYSAQQSNICIGLFSSFPLSSVLAKSKCMREKAAPVVSGSENIPLHVLGVQSMVLKPTRAEGPRWNSCKDANRTRYVHLDTGRLWWWRRIAFLAGHLSRSGTRVVCLSKNPQSARPQSCSRDSRPQTCTAPRRSGCAKLKWFRSESSAMLRSESLCILMRLKTASSMVLKWSQSSWTSVITHEKKMKKITSFKNFGAASLRFLGCTWERHSCGFEKFSFTCRHNNHQEMQHLNDFLGQSFAPYSELF